MKNKRIILLHGWGASTKKLVPLKDELEKLGWEVILPELPGFDAPDPGRPWGLRDYAEYVSNVLEEKWPDKRYVIFGHSFGGRIAIKMATGKQEGLRAIVLCGAGGLSRGFALKRYLFLTISKLGKILLIFPPAANFFRKLLYKFAREHDYEKSNEIMKRTMRNVIGEDLKEETANIDLDTLILWGERDNMTPIKDGLYLQRTIRNSKLKIYKDVGHSLPYVFPKKIANEIDKWIS